jgi:hypothetical protein
MPDAENVRVALTGAVMSADLGTAAPIDPTVAWGTGWVDLGYISEDGVTEAYADDTNEIKAWQGGATVRTVITGSTATYAFTAIETNLEALSRYHKGSTFTDDGLGGFTTVEVVGATADLRAWGFDIIDGSNHIRIILEKAEVTERGDIVYNNSDPIGYELTVTAYPNENGVVAVKFIDAAAVVGGAAAVDLAARGNGRNGGTEVPEAGQLPPGYPQPGEPQPEPQPGQPEPQPEPQPQPARQGAARG